MVMKGKAKEIVLRAALPSDAEALLSIYEPYVAETAVSFEYEVPSPDEFRARIEEPIFFSVVATPLS